MKAAPRGRRGAVAGGEQPPGEPRRAEGEDCFPGGRGQDARPGHPGCGGQGRDRVKLGTGSCSLLEEADLAGSWNLRVSAVRSSRV